MLTVTPWLARSMVVLNVSGAGRRARFDRFVDRRCRGILRPKMISMLSGRPRSRLSAMRVSKNVRAWRGAEHDRAGELDLPHRQVPPVAGGPVRGRQRQRQPR